MSKLNKNCISDDILKLILGSGNFLELFVIPGLSFMGGLVINILLIETFKGMKLLSISSFLGTLGNIFVYVFILYYFLFFLSFLIIPLTQIGISYIETMWEFILKRKIRRQLRKKFHSTIESIVPTAIFGYIDFTTAQSITQSNPYILDNNIFDYFVNIIDIDGDFVKFDIIAENYLPSCEVTEVWNKNSIKYYKHSKRIFSMKKKDFLKIYVFTGKFFE